MKRKVISMVLSTLMVCTSVVPTVMAEKAIVEKPEVQEDVNMSKKETLEGVDKEEESGSATTDVVADEVSEELLEEKIEEGNIEEEKAEVVRVEINKENFQDKNLRAYLQNEYGEDAFAGIMIGRGAVANPGIFREIKTGQKMTLQELKEWHNDLFAEYEQTFSANDALYKMKEVWFYLSHSFDGIDKPLKNIRKCNTKADYFAAVREVWRGEYCGIDDLKFW